MRNDITRIKSISEIEGFFSDALVFDENCTLSAQAMQMLSLFMPALAVKKGVSANVNFFEKNALKNGAYELLIKHTRIIVNYGDYEGVRNAMSTLAQLYQDGKIKCCEIFDKPNNVFRSCMLDLARGYVEIPVLKEHIVRMALLKYNHIHLHLMDRQSYVLQSDVVPNPVGYKQYTKQELRDLAEFCKLLGLEVIPEIEIPAHAVNQIKALPELACELIDRKKAVGTIAKLENPRKREFTDNQKCISS